MNDELGDRIKSQYESRTRYLLPRRTYTIIRLDGKAFHTYTKGLDKPFDKGLQEDMDNAVCAMIREVQGAQFAYVQSDEISILVTDFATPETSAWFDGNLQKICSVSASLITSEFNKFRARRWRMELEANMFMETHGMGEEASEHSNQCTPDGSEFKLAQFDSRVFTIPDRTEVMNYFIWRNKDCTRNSVSMVAYANFSHKDIEGKGNTDKLNMLKECGLDWETKFTAGEKYGRLIIKEEYVTDIVPKSTQIVGNSAVSIQCTGIRRTRWVSKDSWKFTDNKDKLLEMIPKYL
jgi:tRNA(His) guanylyltransferase